MEITPSTVNNAGTKRSGAAEHRATVRPGAPPRGQLSKNQSEHLSSVHPDFEQTRRPLVPAIEVEQPTDLQHSHLQSPPDIAGTLMSRTISKDTKNTAVDCISPKRQVIKK